MSVFVLLTSLRSLLGAEVPVDSIVSFFSPATTDSLLCVHHFCLHSSGHAQLVSSRFRDIINTAVVPAAVHGSSGIFVFKPYTPKRGTAQSYGSSLSEFLLKAPASHCLPHYTLGGFPSLHLSELFASVDVLMMAVSVGPVTPPPSLL